MDDDVPVAIYLAPAQRVDERHGYKVHARSGGVGMRYSVRLLDGVSLL